MQALDFLIPKINKDEQKFLLKLAKDSIEACVKTYSLPSVDKSKLSNVLQKDGACFVTLMINDKLRGCIGSVVPHKPLYLYVIDNAISASSKDPRFPKLSKNEFENLTISISILGDLFEIKYNTLEELFSLIEPFKDGLVLQNGPYQGLFLPSVWEELPSKDLFLSNLCLKAGFEPSNWHNDIKVYKFRTLYIK